MMFTFLLGVHSFIRWLVGLFTLSNERGVGIRTAENARNASDAAGNRRTATKNRRSVPPVSP